MALFFITLRETIEFSIVVLLLTGVYRAYRKGLVIFAVLVVLSGFLVTFINYPLSGFFEKAYTGLMFYSFIMLLFLSFISTERVIYPLISLVLALLLPSAQLAEVILTEATLMGNSIYIYASAGILTGGFIFTYSLRFMSRFGMRRFFNTNGVMVFLATFCFVFGGMNEFDNSPIVVSLQRGLYTFLSSFVSSFEDFLLIPHGGIISLPFSGVLDYLMSQRVAMALTSLILFIPPLYVFIKLLLTPEPSTEEIGVRAERRKVLSIYIDELIKKGTPLLFSLFISIVMLHSANLKLNPTYDPEPIPVIVEGDTVEIVLTGRYGDISDGRLRKYSFHYRGETYRVLVMMRPDGKVVTALDACEICPPEGYVQRGGYLVCKYCSTPIPSQSIGQPGGCNPIPLEFKMQGNKLILDTDHIVNTYDKWVGNG